MKVCKNPAVSIRQRLLNLARESRRPFNEILVHYVMERFLYRLSRSPYSDLFVLKGAMMFKVWCAAELRPTMDIDLLGKTRNDEANIIDLVKAVLATNVVADGLEFDVDSIRTEQITQDVAYIGIRIRIAAFLDTARVNMRLDIGFDDAVFPEPKLITFPTLLDLPPPEVKGYSMESAIAEKLDAMIKHGALNSRMKDFFDIWILSSHFSFKGEYVKEAFRKTFKKRSSAPPKKMEAFRRDYIQSHESHWRTFIKRMGRSDEKLTFQEVVEDIERFVTPPLEAIRIGNDFVMNWTPEKKWR